MMKRPLVLVGFSYLLTLAAAVYFGPYLSLVFACLSLAGFLITMLVPKARAAAVFPAALIAGSLAFGSFYAYHQSLIKPAEQLAGQDAVIDATVCELPYQAYNRFYYIVEVNDISLKDAPRPLKIRISSQNALLVEPYSHIKGKVHLFLPQGGEGFSSRSYYASKGITLFSYLYEYENVQVSPPTHKPPYYYALKLRSALLKSVRSMLPPNEADLVNGVLFGDQTSLSPQVTSDFRAIGISHILSVSGLHMTTMAELLLMLLLFFRIPKKPAAAMAGAGVVCFMAITCFVPSVTRSGVMCLIYLSGMLLSRHPDSLNSLSISVLLIGLANPYAAADVGLLLSFSATLGLILFSGQTAGYLNRKYDKIKKIRPFVRGVNGILGTTVWAVLFTLPIVILSFGSVSLAAPIANLLELVPSTLMMNFAAIAAVVNLVAPQSFLAMPFALVSGLLAKYMLACAHWLAQLPFASVSASYSFVRIWLAGTILLVAVTVLLMKSKKLFRVTALLSLILLLTGIFSYQLSMRNVTRLAVLDGAESVVLTRNGHAAVIGCGGFRSDTVAEYLRSQGIKKLDVLQPLSLTAEEAKNTAELMAAFTPEKLVIQNDGMIDTFIRREASKTKNVEVYDSFAETKLWKNTDVQARFDGTAGTVRVTTGNVSVLVCPSGAKLTGLSQEWLASDFAVAAAVPEHGELLRPMITILSAEKEELGQDVLQLKKLNPIITGGEGNIVLQFREDGTMELRRE
ncbi:ComEC/Rec2 family competence protein [Caproiciproducens faecalis]|uniref:ComEC/Rec2 family competence protein n=1 Tax=Caproiciproducens faecalis TaxID=2820301 RepID=A0ABS7DPS6_9FIRM|nr:ComEC/Rec2 family competence protein [Caproiciproducens faecalis]MBW7573315.1 ComEC/Rec2 family competence protein [Caproiciproducens faecalis]